MIFGILKPKVCNVNCIYDHRRLCVLKLLRVCALDSDLKIIKSVLFVKRLGQNKQ